MARRRKFSDLGTKQSKGERDAVQKQQSKDKQRLYEEFVVRDHAALFQVRSPEGRLPDLSQVHILK